MSGGDSINLSSQDLHLVQNRIERCLQHYMHKKEVVNALAMSDNIDPAFTELIWQRLEEENPDFFKAYYLKLLVKDQIMEFNRLLSEQVDLMRRIGVGGIAPPILTSNGSHVVSPLQQHVPASCTTQNSRILKTESIQQANMFANCGPSIHPSTVQVTVDGSISPSLFLSHNSNTGLAQASNGNIPRTEANYAGSSHFDFGPAGYFGEAACPLVGDASVSSFGGANTNAHHHLNDSLLDGDGSFGFLSQLPQNLSFPELAADFPDSSDLLGSFTRAPFITPDSNNFLDAHEDIERLDPESGNMRYQYYGGD